MAPYLEPSVKTYTDEFLDQRGKKIFCYYWEPPAGTPRALVHISHGYTEHSMLYEDLAQELAKRNFFVFAHDHVGHGKSDGSRAHINSLSHLQDDTQFHVEMMKKKYPDLPVFLCGHSMGGTVSILLALNRPKDYRGIILISPAVLSNPETASPFRIALAKLVSRILPEWPIAYADYSLTCRDPDRVKTMDNDPLRHHGYFKARAAICIIESGKEILRRKTQLDVPYLLLHGDADKVCHVSGSEMLHQHSSSKDKTLKLYPGGYHSLHCEPEGIADDVYTRIIQWLDTRA